MNDVDGRQGNPSCPPRFNRSRKSLHFRYSFLPPLLCLPFHLSWKLLRSCYSCVHPLCCPPLLRLNSQNPYLVFHCLNYYFFLGCYCLLPVDLQAVCPALLYFAVLKCKSINVVARSACSGTPWLRYHNILSLWDILMMSSRYPQLSACCM